MYYVICKVLDLSEVELGYVVLKEGTEKLADTNLWTEEQSDELREHVADLNRRIELKNHWPESRDPELLALIDDPDFEPLVYGEIEVVDEEETQRLVDTGVITPVKDYTTGSYVVADSDQHLIPMRKERTLIDPSQPMERYRKAAEAIATKRAQATRRK